MNLHCLTDDECSEMIKAISIDMLEICDGDNHRQLTLADVESFAA